MNHLLTKLFKKRGITDPNDLSTEEKQIFDGWQKVLSKEELTLQDVKEFCSGQVGIIENKWRDYNLSNERKAELIAYHTVYKTLLTAIDSPQTAREALEQYLNQLTN